MEYAKIETPVFQRIEVSLKYFIVYIYEYF